MSASSKVHNNTILFYGTNYDLWRNRLLCNLRTLCPNIERFLDVGFSPPMDPQNLSLEDEKNLHLEAQVSNKFLLSLSPAFLHLFARSKGKSSHEMWTNLEEIFGGSISHEAGGHSEELSSPSHHEELQVASTSGRDEFSIPSTSPTCDKSQGNGMVSGEIICDDGSVSLYTDDSCSINANGVESLDLNTCWNNGSISSRVSSPCISSRNNLSTSVDDMLDMSCCHDQNASISSSCLMANNVEETKHSMEQDTIMSGDSRRSSSSSSGTHMCLMANGSKVSPTLTYFTSSDDESDDDDVDEDTKIVLREMTFLCTSFRSNNKALACLKHVMGTFSKQLGTIAELESHVDDGRRRFNLLKQELSEEKHTNFLLTQKIESYELEKEKSINDACATNSTSCEASTLKENVELRAQLALLTSNYRKLEENHEKLLGSHNDLLISYDGLKLALEASITKVTSCEPHVDISTTFTQNAILPCSSPSNPSSHTIDKSCVGLLTLPCCSNNEASTFSSTSISTNHVEEIKELKAQVTSLKKEPIRQIVL